MKEPRIQAPQMKRCKNCRLWRPYVSDHTNRVAVNYLNLQLTSKSHACTLRLREVTNDASEKIKIPSRDPADEAGPRYGHRTSPWAVCAHFTAKPRPYVTPEPLVFESAPQVLPTDYVLSEGMASLADV